MEINRYMGKKDKRPRPNEHDCVPRKPGMRSWIGKPPKSYTDALKKYNDWKKRHAE